MVEQQVLLRMRAKLLLGGGPQGIANLQQGFLQNSHSQSDDQPLMIQHNMNPHRALTLTGQF